MEWHSPTPPYSHQLAFKEWRRGLRLRAGDEYPLGPGSPHPSCLAELGMGVGKTLIAIEEILSLLRFRPNAHTLVLARHANLDTVWGEQLPQHAPGLPFTILDMPRRKRLELLSEHETPTAPHVWVHSHEDLPGFGNELAKYQWDLIILDECARFRNAGAARTKLLTRPNRTNVLRLDGDYKIALSGMPMIKSVADLYPVLRWLGAWKGDKAAFMNRFVFVDGMGREIASDERALLALLETCRFQVPRNAIRNIPRSWRYDRLPMPKWQREAYARIQAELRTRYLDPDTGELLEAEIRSRLSEMLRLHQVAAGFEAIDQDRWEWHDDNAKTKNLLDVVMPELDGERVIIWTVFQPEATNITRCLLEAGYKAVAFHGGQSPDVNKAGYDAWKAPDSDVQCFVSTLAKGSTGLNLPEASAMVYHSRNYDTEAVAQSLERNHRLTTEHEQLRVVVLEAQGTIDPRISAALGDDYRKAAALTSIDLRAMLGEEG